MPSVTRLRTQFTNRMPRYWVPLPAYANAMVRGAAATDDGADVDSGKVLMTASMGSSGDRIAVHWGTRATSRQAATRPAAEPSDASSPGPAARSGRRLHLERVAHGERARMHHAHEPAAPALQ